MLGEADGLTIFEGVLNAILEAVRVADCCGEEDSDTAKRFCEINTGN